MVALLALLCSGCTALRDMHEDAMASIDASSAHYNGQSPYHTSNNSPEANVKWLMVEPFFTSAGSMGGGSHFDQPDPQGDIPTGGPSDRTRHNSYNFLRPPVTAPAAGYFSPVGRNRVCGQRLQDNF